MLPEAISSPSTVFNPIMRPIPIPPLGETMKKESPRAVATKPGYISYDASLKGILRIKSIDWIDGTDSDQMSDVPDSRPDSVDLSVIPTSVPSNNLTLENE